jgi:hypothetical protein
MCLPWPSCFLLCHNETFSSVATYTFAAHDAENIPWE